MRSHVRIGGECWCLQAGKHAARNTVGSISEARTTFKNETPYRLIVEFTRNGDVKQESSVMPGQEKRYDFGFSKSWVGYVNLAVEATAPFHPDAFAKCGFNVANANRVQTGNDTTLAQWSPHKCKVHPTIPPKYENMTFECEKSFKPHAKHWSTKITLTGQ